MTDTAGLIVSFLLQLAVLLGAAPLVTGLIRKTKARTQRRRGAGLFQPYADLGKLFRKEVVVSSVSSWIFRATPYIAFCSTLAIALLVPAVAAPVPFGWMGDIITVVYLFALGRFFVALAGLDAGSAFGGLGSSREMSIASIVEPAMMLAIFTAAATAGSTNLGVIVERLAASPSAMLNPARLLAFAGLFIVTLAESGRIPVDNPATHLELTMIHEAMILEYSGRHLAFIEWASQVKLVVFLVLMANMFFPLGVAGDLSPFALALGTAAILAKVLLLAVAVALVESTNAKLRLFRVPELLTVAFILSLLALILYFIVGGA
ncbi:MAG TPA: NADH-quinone oxidoreductase subunit H [Bacteroidota bacterium]|nr:NADH-quinone oxidoreductase subunit H [Bacteroidota bacterium]